MESVLHSIDLLGYMLQKVCNQECKEMVKDNNNNNHKLSLDPLVPGQSRAQCLLSRKPGQRSDSASACIWIRK